MVSGISFSGLASGLDTPKIIDALLKVDQTRIDNLKLQRSALDSQVSSLGTLKSKLLTLQTRLDALRFQSQVLTQSATSNQPTIATATVDSTATPGTFRVTVDQLATATRRQGAANISTQWFDQSLAPGAAGWSLAPTAGRFTINGVGITVASPTSIDDFVQAINAAQSQTGVIASYVTDGAGRSVGIQIQNDGSKPPGAAIQLGSAGDTSNFLNAAKLATATQAGETVQSTTTLGRLSTTSLLSASRLATTPAATGSFTINGVSFTYDTSTDSIATVLANINASGANVSATYDSVSDRINIAAKSTGAQSIAISDTSGDLMQALGVTTGAGATEALGTNALYRVDTVAGGAQQSSTTNTITGVLTGVTLNLLQQSATPADITVAQDTAPPLAAMKDFLTAFNDVTSFVRDNSVPTADGKPGAFQGNLGVRLLADRLRSITTSNVTGLSGPYNSLASLGVTSGAVGSTPGTTSTLSVDETKFKDALSANPLAAYDVMNSVTAGSQGVFTQLRSYVTTNTLPTGMVGTATTTAAARQTDLDSRIAQNQRLLDLKRRHLEAQFSKMESAVAQLQSQGQRLQAQLGNQQSSR